MDGEKAKVTPEGLDRSLKGQTNDGVELKQQPEETDSVVLPVYDKVFPFSCSNEKCGHGYDQVEFCIAANQWGYILLANSQNTLIGLTCPKCNNTTVRKYSFLGNDLKEIIPNGLNMYVLFLKEKLLGIDGDCADKEFKIPRFITPIKQYPKWFLDACLSSFNGADIERVVEFENMHKKKIFPRIVSSTSIYNRTDDLLDRFKGNANPSDVSEISEFLHSFLINLAKWYYFRETFYQDQKRFPEKDINYYRLLFCLPPDFAGEFDSDLVGMLMEYIEKRRFFDFDLNYGPMLFDKYIERFYYDKKYYKSDEYYYDKWQYEGIFGKYFKNNIPRIDNSQVSEILTADQVQERYRIAPKVLKGFILNRDLPAYNEDWTYLSPDSSIFKSMKFDPAELLYLKSEIEELFLMHQSLKKEEMPEEAVYEKESDESTREYAKLIFEEGKWESSICAAMGIGLLCGAGDKILRAEDVINIVDGVDPELPCSTLEAIWSAIPDDHKSDDTNLKTLKLIDRKKRESAMFFGGEPDAISRRNLPAKKKKAEKRIKSIRVAINIGIRLKQDGAQWKRNELLNEIDRLESGLTVQISNMIVKAVPGKYRCGSGNPRRIRSKDIQETE